MKIVLSSALLVLLCLCGANAAAQSVSTYPSVELFGGYAYASVNYAGQRANFNGWEGSFAGNLNRRFGFVADVSQVYGPTFGGSSNRLFLLFGPQVTWRTDKTNVFVHGMVGAAHKDRYINPFSFAVGGGLDYSLTPKVALRVVQADYIMTRFQGPPCGAAGCIGSDQLQHNIRVSMGIVFTLARKR